MQTAVVTGASSGIGEQMTETLLHLDYRVYGLARDFTKQQLTYEQYYPLSCDVSDLTQLTKAVTHIKQREKDISILINNAGVGFFGLHDQLKPEEIATMVATNLQAPLILTRLLLPSLKKSKGYIINISSITAQKASTHGCAYAATKAGLTHFGDSLFEEVRKTGVKVVNIHPDMTQTPFYDQLYFKEGEVPESYITPQCVADALKMILHQREGTIISNMTLRPQRQMITRKLAGK